VIIHPICLGGLVFARRYGLIFKRRRHSGSELDPAPINEVVIALGSRKKVTLDSLFTFSKVNLVRQVRMIQANQVEVRIVSVQLA
jgi:hypothetical protein